MKQKNFISMLVTSGNGPAECRLAVARVLTQMQKEAVALDLTLDVSETAAKHGPKSAVVLVYGMGSVAFGKRWVGSIKWQIKSPFRPHHKRTNWFIGVFALAKPQQSLVRVQECDVNFESFRAGGPGGQHQNTTDSAVRALHRPSGMVAVAREMRSQHRNKALAFERLQGLADARLLADQEELRCDENRLHTALERGNPLRCFVGARFKEKGGKGCSI